MSKRSFLITMAVAAVMAVTVIIFGACAVKQAEQDVADTDAYIESLSERTESTRTAFYAETEEISTETTELVKTAIKGAEHETTTNGNVNDSNSVDSNIPVDDGDRYIDSASVEEIAQDVIDGKYGNGDARKEALGSRYEEVQNYIDANYAPPVRTYDYPTGSVLTPDKGVNQWNGITETYYNLDMSGVVDWMHSLGYDYDYWVRSDGVKMFGNYVMVAADYGWLPKGSIVECSLGTAIVCDTGLGGWYWLDVAVDW